MKAQISAGLNFSISGIPFWTQDIGGFSVENRYMAAQQEYDKTGIENKDLTEWRELQARWHEWGIFCPLYRADCASLRISLLRNILHIRLLSMPTNSATGLCHTSIP